MKTGIDSYCFHRFFGETYPQQTSPGRTMTLEDFIKRAHELGVGGVSLESCFIPRKDAEYLGSVRKLLDGYGLDRVWAWGHPDGLEGGTKEKAYEDMIANFEYAKNVGAKVMRVVGASAFYKDPRAPQVERLISMFRKAVKVAEKYGIKLALENHLDFNSDEMLQIMEGVDSPWLGVNFDTGNALRLLDDPVKAMTKLSRYVYATHIKDLKIQRGIAADEWYFFSSAAVGDGIVDMPKLVQLLAEAGYDGVLAVETDFLHPDYNNDEDAAVAKSVAELKRLTANVKAVSSSR